MKFDLDETLICDILFHMENQENKFVYDTLNSKITPDINKEPGDHYIHLPEWTPADGFRIMQKFTNSLKNPVLRQELTDALNRNKGVFRAFKDVLDQHPQTAKQWLAFKNQKMKNEVIAWYNALREEWGLEPIGEEPEDTTGLVLEDFIFEQEGEYGFFAKTQDGEPAGCICAQEHKDGLHINKLEVLPEFRGLGLGKTLLAKFLEKAGDQPVSIDVPADMDFFSRSLLLEGFKPASQKFIKS